LPVLLVDLGDEKGGPSCQMPKSNGELGGFHAPATSFESLGRTVDEVGEVILFADELVPLVFKSAVSMHFCDGGWAVKADRLFDERVESAIPRPKE
jgi:hypothetical protein